MRRRRRRGLLRPGGTLDLHADSGQIALADAGLLDAFTAQARPEGQVKTRRDYHGTVLAEFAPGPASRPRRRRAACSSTACGPAPSAGATGSSARPRSATAGTAWSSLAAPPWRPSW
ncbi:hypothetical protein ACWC9T_17215 [Kitasatospora sp. NPDC001159]